jgi:hypothetical protein
VVWKITLLGTGITSIDAIADQSRVLSLSREPTGVFYFPGLRKINILELLVPHERVSFLRLHAPTLEKLVIQMVGIRHGTWIEPLEVIETMPRLNDLCLNTLLERDPYPHSLKLTKSHVGDARDLDVYSQEEVETALSAMRDRPMTVSTDERFQGAGGEVYSHMVTWHRAYAALSGEMVYRDGQWVSEDEIEDEEDMEDDDEEDQEEDEDADV